MRPDYAQEHFGPRQEFRPGDVGAAAPFQLASFTPQALDNPTPPPVTVRKPKPDAQPVPAPGLDPQDLPPVLTPTVWQAPTAAAPVDAPQDADGAQDLGAPRADRDDFRQPTPAPAMADPAEGGGVKTASSDDGN